MRTRGVLLGAVVSVVVFVQPTATSAIISGEAITSAPPWAAYVTVTTKFLFEQEQVSSCTGTIVGNGWVLTAEHCTYQDTGKPIPVREFRVVLGRSNLANIFQGRQYTVDKVARYPSYASGGGDVALLHLVGALPSHAKPLPLAPSGYALAIREPVDAYGYGCTGVTYSKIAIKDKQWSNYKRPCREAKYLGLTDEDSYSAEQIGCPAEFSCFERDGTSEVTFGDSGGPWITEPNAPFILAVTHGADGSPKISADTVSWPYEIATSVATPALHEWLDREAGIAGGVNGTIYRNAATGESWLFEEGVRHGIPDGGTFECLASTHAVVEMEPFTLEELPWVSENATCGHPVINQRQRHLTLRWR